MDKESDKLIEELRNLSTRVSEKLWSIVKNHPDRPHLIFPEYRDNKTRISEQESKILFSNILENSEWFYSVETPTLQTYIQSGKTPLSARTDISLFRNPDPASKAVNIELKAHNATAESFRKDLEKLLREQLDGLWFHTLENRNKGTLPRIYEKIQRAFSDLKPHIQGKHRKILFAFCLLRTEELIFKIVTIDGSVDKNIELIQQTFDKDTI